MTRGSMRNLLRRRINDTSDQAEGRFFTDGELNEALNLASAKIEKAILSIDRTALVKITRQNVEEDVNLYPKPQGSWSVLDLKLLDTTTNEYVSLGDPISIEELEKLDTTGNTTKRYAHVGRWIQLAPTPDAAITAGLQWRTIGGAEIEDGDDHDSEVFPFPTAVHNAVVLWAQILLTPELTEGVNTQELRTQLQEELADLPLYFARTVGREVPFSLDIVKRGAV